MPANIPDSSKKLLEYLKERIVIDESPEEKSSIAYYLMDHYFGIDKTEIILDRSINISNNQKKELEKFLKRINDHEPIQYILGEADFYGRTFKVNPAVLIPRSETEELVQLIISENKGKKIKFVDIGTGSGCIPITLSRELKDTRAFAIDFDPRVIKVAKQNAAKYEVEIEFMLIDIINEPLPIQSLDVIVSNPPYVTHSEKEKMKPNVLNYEPFTALFVNDNDPLLFYRRIAELGKSSLKPTGKIYFEVNENFARDVKILLEVMEYADVKIAKDINDKSRIVHAVNSEQFLT